jgi:hypothetical protein
MLDRDKNPARCAIWREYASKGALSPLQKKYFRTFSIMTFTELARDNLSQDIHALDFTTRRLQTYVSLPDNPILNQEKAFSKNALYFFSFNG